MYLISTRDFLITLFCENITLLLRFWIMLLRFIFCVTFKFFHQKPILILFNWLYLEFLVWYFYHKWVHIILVTTSVDIELYPEQKCSSKRFQFAIGIETSYLGIIRQKQKILIFYAFLKLTLICLQHLMMTLYKYPDPFSKDWSHFKLKKRRCLQLI